MYEEFERLRPLRKWQNFLKFFAVVLQRQQLWLHHKAIQFLNCLMFCFNFFFFPKLAMCNYAGLPLLVKLEDIGCQTFVLQTILKHLHSSYIHGTSTVNKIWKGEVLSVCTARARVLDLARSLFSDEKRKLKTSCSIYTRHPPSPAIPLEVSFSSTMCN